MNKSRRMVALQARAFAAAGGAAAVLDLHGTGDSSGAHGEATWDGWGDDVRAAWAWLEQRFTGPCLLWGLRLGGLLATQLVADGTLKAAGLVLWQPVATGRAFFNQWLRLESAQRMTGATAAAKSPGWRSMLDAGQPVDVAGYELNPRLVAGAEAIELRALRPRHCPVVWRETTIAEPPEPSPAATQIAARWAADNDVDIAAVNGASFWSTLEIEEAPELVDSTTEATMALLSRIGGAGG